MHLINKQTFRLEECNIKSKTSREKRKSCSIFFILSEKYRCHIMKQFVLFPHLKRSKSTPLPLWLKLPREISDSSENTQGGSAANGQKRGENTNISSDVMSSSKRASLKTFPLQFRFVLPGRGIQAQERPYCYQ